MSSKTVGDAAPDVANLYLGGRALTRHAECGVDPPCPEGEYPYDRVVAQYREQRARNSMHLMVFTDGHYEIDHLDEDNPDRGRVAQHFFCDVPIGKFVRDVAPYVAIAGLAYLGLRAFTRRDA